MEEMRIEVVVVDQKPDYMPLARHLMRKALAFYEDPENEKAFHEWKKAREAEAAQKGA